MVDVTLTDVAFVADAATQAKAGLLAVAIADLVAAEDRVAIGKPVAMTITSFFPPRINTLAASTLLVIGTGFTPGAMTVTLCDDFTRTRVDCTVAAASSVQVQLTTPGSIFIWQEGFCRVEVHNAHTGQTVSGRIYVYPTPDLFMRIRAPQSIPTPNAEQATAALEDPMACDAHDFERLMTLLEYVTLDCWAGASGDLMSHDGTGLVPVTGSPGQVLESHSSAAAGVRWAWALDLSFGFGGALVANPGGAVLLVANGMQTSAVSGTNSRMLMPRAGTLDAVWMLVKNAGATDTLDRIRVLVNGAAVYDSGTGLGLANNGTHTAAMSIAVAAGDYVEVEATKTGVVDALNLVGGVRVRL